jgi:hypothetical protein
MDTKLLTISPEVQSFLTTKNYLKHPKACVIKLLMTLVGEAAIH